MKSVIFLLILPALCGVLHAQSRWQVDSASVAFEITNAGLPVRGSFAGLDADVRFDPDDPAHSLIVASIDAATVNTGIGLRNRHLLKRDYFHVDQHPRIRMVSERIERSDFDAYSGTFLLEIKGIQRDVTVPFTFTHNSPSGTFEGSFMVDRLDFGLGKSSLILADDVTVHLTVEVSKIAPR